MSATIILIRTPNGPNGCTNSNDPARNIYFWYEGQPGDYAHPNGGYLDNVSTGFAPRYSEEMVRQVFISSAAFFVEVCHIDGFRLDQTSSIHEYNRRHEDGQPVDRANAFGVKFLKQWTRTMRLLRPSLFLTAEDYSEWPAMTALSLEGDGVDSMRPGMATSSITSVSRPATPSCSRKPASATTAVCIWTSSPAR